MSLRARTSILVPIVVVLVGMLFFFHGSDGGFQTMNGPTSTLKECVMGMVLQTLVMLLARVIVAVANHTAVARSRVHRLADPHSLPYSSLTPLRC